MERLRILFLAADPGSMGQVNAGREAREIRERLRAAAHRDAIELVERFAVRPGDLQRTFFEVRPHVVHFSGHGTPEEALVFEGDELLGKRALTELFRVHKDTIRVVVLSACHSRPQVEAIAEHVECAIGMRRAVGSLAATEFSAAFYLAVGFGASVAMAFESAVAELRARGIPEDRTPQLVVRPGTDAARVILLSDGLDPALGARPEPTRRAPFHVPFLRNTGFVGRDDDLATLHDLLQKGGPVGVRPAALTGMGGIGKTQLAVEYAYRYADAYPGGVYWVNAAEPLQAEFARLAIEVGLGAGEGAESERQGRLALAFAAHLRERPDALAVFDNVEDSLALRSPGAGFIPEQLGCRLLFTTRRRDPDSPFETVDVRVLPEDIALRLLLSGGARRSVLEDGRAAELDAAKTICTSLGHLPLALVLAAAFLARYPRIALGDYLTRIRKEGALVALDAARVDPRTLGTLHDAAVGATLRTQWDALESEDAKLVLKAAAVLGEAALVPRARLALLTGLADEAEPGYPAPLEEALRALGGLSLVEELTEQAIRLHPLVREFAEKQIAGREAFAAECAGRLWDALWDMGRLHEEVARRGVDAVLTDLRVGSKLVRASARWRFEALRRPLNRESHALRRWHREKEPGFFLQQFRNRCFEMGLQEARAGAEARLEEQGRPWLRERFPNSRESEALVRTLEGHTGLVTGVAVTSDGRFAVSASGDKTLKAWDLATGQVVRTLEGHTRWVCGVAVTSDGRFAVSASEDKTLKVWDLATGQAVRTLEGHTNWVCGVAVTSDGRFAVSASDDQTLKVWDLATGQAVRTLEGNTKQVGVAVTSDGRFAVSASGDNTLNVWDLDTGRVLRILEGHSNSTRAVAVTSDGRFAVSTSSDNTLKVWDLDTGQALCTLEGHTMYVNDVAVTSDGRVVVSASSDNTLKVWDLDTGQVSRTLEGHTDSVKGVAVTSDGRFAVSASSDNTLKVWALERGQARRTLEGHTHRILGVAVTSDGRFAVSASEDKTLKVWDLDTGRVRCTLEGHTSWVNGAAVTFDGRFAVSASYDNTLKVWDLDTGQLLRTLEGHAEAVRGLAVTSDGRCVVSASSDNTLKVWDLDTGQVLRTLEGHTNYVRGVAVTTDGRFAVSASYDKTLKVWDLATGQALRTLEGHTGSVYGVSVTTDGRFAVSASFDRTLKVWDLATGQALRTLEGHTASVYGVSVTADGRFVVSASWDRTLKVWDLRTGRCIATLDAHAPLRCCAVTADGNTILAGDEAGALHILDWRKGGA